MSASYLLEHEAALRLGAFALVFAAMAVWEVLAPCRARTLSRARRWTGNLGIVVLDAALVRFALPAGAVAFATLAQARGWGMLNQYELPFAVAALVSIVALDFVIWLQHVVFHAVPALWRLHRVHHADPEFDVTTGARFHPLEILLSMLIKLAAIAVLGPPAAAVMLFEVLLNATAMFNHGNVRLPALLERALRLLVVTPDVHRVHHSVEPRETNSNFGFNLSVWDRLFGTWRAQPAAGHSGMAIGVRGMREPRLVVDLPGMLALPFVGADGDYAIGGGRREREA